MSLLLDALNKADQERKRDQPSIDTNSPHAHASKHGTRQLSPTILAATALGLSALLLALAAAFYWPGQDSTATKTAVTAAAAPDAINSEAELINSKTEIINLEAEPINSKAALINSETGAIHSKADATHSEVGAINSEQAEIAHAQDVAGLYEKNAHAEAIALLAAVNPVDTANTLAAGNTTPLDDTAPLDHSAKAAAPVSLRQFSNLPDLHDLPVELLAKIPSLNYSEHHYHPSGGYVKINGDIKHVNEQVANELFIDKILEDGMILHLNNYSFKMRALNSWVNM